MSRPLRGRCVIMTKLADETLMLYADGLLAPAEGKRVERILAQSPYLRGRLQVYRATGTNLAGVFDEHMNAPIPAGLRDLLSEAKPAESVNFPRRSQSPRRHFPLALQSPAKWKIPALAASMAIVVGIGIGWMLGAETADRDMMPGNLLQIHGNRLIAQGPLHTALEELPSGNKRAVLVEGKQFQLGLKMTFRNEAGDYCREYELASTSPPRYAGLACRIGGQWTVKMQALVPSSPSASEQTIPAGSRDFGMDAVIGAVMDGDPLGLEAEVRLLNKGWEKE